MLKQYMVAIQFADEADAVGDDAIQAVLQKEYPNAKVKAVSLMNVTQLTDIEARKVNKTIGR